jgi:hypothetical protein
MIGAVALAWRYAANLNIERMPLVQVHGQRLTPQRHDGLRLAGQQKQQSITKA